MYGRTRMDNKGFTLVEIMLSIAILALISVPLMKYFSDSLKYAAQTAEKQKATMIAQETIEFIKSQKKIVKPVVVSVTATPATSSTPDALATPAASAKYALSSELVYLFGGYTLMSPAPSAVPTPEIITPVQFDASGATIDSIGNVSPLVYRYVDKKSGKYYMEVSLSCITPADEVSSPAILTIDDSKNVVVAERTEMMDAITHFSTLNINQYMSWNGGMLEDPDMTPSPTPDEFIYVTMSPNPSSTPSFAEYKQLSEAEIRANMDRIIYITISKGVTDTKFTVSAYYQFFCKDVFGPGTDSDMEYPSATICEATVESLEGIFLMFNKMSETCDNIQINWEVADPNVEYPDFRFVVQDDIVTEEDIVATPDPAATPTPTPEATTAPDPDAVYNLVVNFHNFTSSLFKPKIHSNLPAGNFTFQNVLTPITKPNDTSAGASPRDDLSVLTLTGNGVPVRIFDIEVKVYADKKAYTDGKDPLVTLKTSKVE